MREAGRRIGGGNTQQTVGSRKPTYCSLVAQWGERLPSAQEDSGSIPFGTTFPFFFLFAVCAAAKRSTKCMTTLKQFATKNAQRGARTPDPGLIRPMLYQLSYPSGAECFSAHFHGTTTPPPIDVAAVIVRCGWMAERSKAPVSGTGLFGGVGSNPTPISFRPPSLFFV